MREPQGRASGIEAGHTPVHVPGARAIMVPGRAGPRRILVAAPDGPAPQAGFPALFVLDGSETFATALATLRSQSRRASVTGVPEAILVGIGEGAADKGRVFDYTPAAAVDRLGARPDGSAWAATGGADGFLDFLSRIVLPRLVIDHPIDVGRLALFGHSLGGLLGLHAALTRPGLFASVIASSPSVWFGSGIVRERLRQAPVAAPRLLLTVGGEEQTIEAGYDARYADWVRQNRMVDNAREFAKSLESHGWQATFHLFEGETHGSVVPAALSRAVRFAFRP